jgi:hypothetical protein
MQAQEIIQATTKVVSMFDLTIDGGPIVVTLENLQAAVDVMRADERVMRNTECALTIVSIEQFLAANTMEVTELPGGGTTTKVSPVEKSTDVLTMVNTDTGDERDIPFDIPTPTPTVVVPVDEIIPPFEEPLPEGESMDLQEELEKIDLNNPPADDASAAMVEVMEEVMDEVITGTKRPWWKPSLKAYRAGKLMKLTKARAIAFATPVEDIGVEQEHLDLLFHDSPESKSKVKGVQGMRNKLGDKIIAFKLKRADKKDSDGSAKTGRLAGIKLYLLSMKPLTKEEKAFKLKKAQEFAFNCNVEDIGVDQGDLDGLFGTSGKAAEQAA